MASQIRHQDIIFSSQQQPSISALLSDLRRSNITIHNRLNSIQHDADFVCRVGRVYGPSRSQTSEKRTRPLVANERCGSWYIPPLQKDGSAYFKSTDGHERAWKFSTRRLNLHIAELAAENDGVIIIDSTRRGKRMPDALSTTIPIWCTVLNQAMLPENPLSKQLFLPPYMSQSTHSQISALIPSFVASLLDLRVQLPIDKITKPMRPFWVTQDSHLPDRDVLTGEESSETIEQAIFDEYTPIICCTASKRVVGSEMDEGGYIQGAGDDTENWAHGLTPDVFWSNKDLLLNTSELELPDIIASLMQEHEEAVAAAIDATSTSFTRLTPHISVGTLSQIPPPPLVQPEEAQSTQDSTCYIILTPKTTPSESWIKSTSYMEAGLGKSKAGSRNLRLALQEIYTFANNFMQLHGNAGQLVIACDTGKDLSIGTSLAISCHLFDDENVLRSKGSETIFNKNLVKSRLAGFMITYPAANPSRATLQSVNSFLMDWRNP